MQSSSQPSLPIYWLRTILGVQLALTHAIAASAAVMLVLLNQRAASTRMVMVFAILVAALAGVALTVNVQNAIAAIYRELVRLNAGLPVPPLRTLRVDPLAPLISQINRLAERDIGNLREALLAQTREAAIQEERNRLARELHDSIKQQMFSINVSAAAAEAQWEKQPSAARSDLTDVRESVRGAIAEMNALLQHLAPAPLEKVGLIEALREQAEALGYRTGAHVHVEIGELPDDERLPVGTQEALFRIAQEALSNVARHARAQTVTLRLYERDDHVHLVVEDDGQGFDIQVISGGRGLSNIRSRAAALGGRAEITSTPTSGTSIHISVPLVDAIVLQEEAMDKIDHTYNKIFLTGAVGGLLVIGALYIPLFILLPGQYVENWPQVPALLGPAGWLAAVALTIGTGYLAARWAKAGSRWQASVFGAIAASAAVLIAFVGIGAGAASVLGTRPILEWGYRPANDHLHLMQMGMDSTLGAFVWNYRALWGSLIAGIGLGGLGGIIVMPVRARPDSDNLLRGARLLLTLTIVGASLALTLHIPMLSRVEPIVRQVWEIIAAARPVMHAPEVIAILPLASTLVTLIGALGARYMIQRADAQSADKDRLLTARTTGPILAAWSPALAAFLVWVTPEVLSITGLRPILVISLALSVLLSLLYVAEALRASRRLAEMQIARPAAIQVGGVVLGMLIFAAFAMLLFWQGINGLGRDANLGIYHSALSQMDIGQPWPYTLPIVDPFGTLPASRALVELAWFDQHGLLKTLVGTAGILLAHWLLQVTAVTTGATPSLRSRQLTRTVAGSLLGLILIVSLATTLPATAATTFYTIVFGSTGVEMFRDRGAVADPYQHGLEHVQVLPLWPLSYYGEDVTEAPDPAPPDAEERLLEFSQQTGIAVEELRAMNERSRTLEYRVARAYHQQYILPVAVPIVLLILSGLAWLLVGGIDMLAWRRARELAQQLREQDEASAAAS